MRGGALIAVCLVALIAVVGAPSALAHTNPAVDDLLYDSGGTQVTGDALDELKVKLGSGEYTIQGPTGEADDVLNKTRRGSRLLPLLRVAGLVGIATTGVDATVGWRFCLEASCPGTGWLYRTIAAGSYAGTNGNDYPGPGWVYCENGGGTSAPDCGFSSSSYFGGSVIPTGWWAKGYTGVSFSQPTAYCTAAGMAFCLGTGSFEGQGTYSTMMQAQSGTQYASTNSTGGCGLSATGVGRCAIKGRTDAEMDTATETHTVDQATYDALATKLSTGSHVPPTTATTADKEAAATALGGPGANTAAQEAAEEEIATALDPTWAQIPMPDCLGGTEAACDAALDLAGHTGTRTYTVLTTGTADPGEPADAVVTQSQPASTEIDPATAVVFTVNPSDEEMPFTILQPAPNETYTAYVTRLETAGWLGTATLVAEATELDGYGPEAVTRVQLESVPGTVRTLDPLAWPAVAVSVAAGTDITVRHNGETATPVPTEGPGAPGGGGGGIDFGPLAPDDACTKFPFGVICWIGDQLELLFLQDARAPHISMTTPEFDTALGTIPPMTFGWDFEDLPPSYESYVSLIRAALGFLLWLGGLWYLGTKLLGVRGAPDTEGGVD